MHISWAEIALGLTPTFSMHEKLVCSPEVMPG
jgi:hypothetical protein